MADQQNPFELAGMMSMMTPNPYTQYGQGQRLPIPGYMGTPTDAQGNPIKSFTDAQSAHDQWAAANPAPAVSAQGTTLNSTPASQLQSMLSSPSEMNPSGNAAVGMADWGGFLPPGTNTGYSASQGQAAPPAPAQSQNPVDMRQAYLTALANPGKVTTPGANVPQAQPLGTPSVMNAFLAANPSGGGAGAGGYNNTGFFSTLNKLRAS